MTASRWFLLPLSALTILVSLPATALAARPPAGRRAHAQRAALAQTTQTCPTVKESEPFTPWGDTGTYSLIPGGDFESASWTASAGARRVAGSEPFAATGVLGAWSASLPVGGAVTSPQFCIDAAEPTMRLFVGGTGSALVQIVDNGVSIPLGTVVASGRWQPSPVMVTGSPVLGPQSGGTAEVSVKITGLSGSPLVDDVFIDPWNRG